MKEVLHTFIFERLPKYLHVSILEYVINIRQGLVPKFKRGLVKFKRVKSYDK